MELSVNYMKTNNRMNSLFMRQRIFCPLINKQGKNNTRDLRPFINKYEWNNARNSLSYILLPDMFAKVGAIYHAYELIEATICKPAITSDEIRELRARYKITSDLTHGAIRYLSEEIGEKFELPLPIDLNEHPNQEETETT